MTKEEHGGVLRSDARVRDAFRAGGGAALTVAFLATWVPCFLRNGLLGSACFASSAVELFAQALPAGCLVASTLFLLVRPLRIMETELWRSTLRGAIISYAAGYVLLVVALTASPRLAEGAGFVAGLGVVPLGIWWCSQAKALDFSSMLLQGSGVGVGVLALALLLGLLPVFACACCWSALAFLVSWWSFASMGKMASAGGYEREAPLEPGKFSELISARSAFSVIATSAIGLMPFVLLSDALQGVVLAGFTFNAASGLFIGSALIFILAWFARGNKPIAPTLFWTVFPVCAGVLVVLVSFPKETPLSALSAGLAYAYFSMIGVFVVVCLAQVVAQREFPPAAVVAPPFLLASIASLFASVLRDLVTDIETAGAVVLVVTMVYFVFLMLAPGFQLRRILRDEESATAPNSASSIDFDEACSVLAERYGLSKREREVFRYLVKGYTSPYIAKALFVSDSTVRSHTKSIYRKCEVNSRTELIESVQRFATAGEG